MTSPPLNQANAQARAQAQAAAQAKAQAAAQARAQAQAAAQAKAQAAAQARAQAQAAAQAKAQAAAAQAKAQQEAQVRAQQEANARAQQEAQARAQAAAQAKAQQEAAAQAKAQQEAAAAAAAAEAERQRQAAAAAAAAEAERQRQEQEAAAARYEAQERARQTAPTFTSTSGYATKSTPIGRVAQRATGGMIRMAGGGQAPRQAVSPRTVALQKQARKFANANPMYQWKTADGKSVDVDALKAADPNFDPTKATTSVRDPRLQADFNRAIALKTNTANRGPRADQNPFAYANQRDDLIKQEQLGHDYRTANDGSVWDFNTFDGKQGFDEANAAASNMMMRRGGKVHVSKFLAGGNVSTEDRSTINAAEEQGFRFNPDQMTAAEENEAEIRQALAEAKNDSQKLKIYKARSMSAAEKARADKAAKEAQENEDSAVEGMKKGGKVKKSSDKKWIAKAVKKPGALRKSLGVKEGEKIPAKKLAEAAKKPGKMGQRARLAQTFKGFKEGGSIRGGGCESRGKTRCKFV